MAEGRIIQHVAGIIAEYNPLHPGHVVLMEAARRQAGTAVICCMSGDFVQRGDLAVVRRQARAQAAVLSGADLVLELPLPWAVSSAEGFAEGGVTHLLATGLVDTLVFGSECGDAKLLQDVAALLLRGDFSASLREELSKGISFPAARQRAAERLGGNAVGTVLSHPNDLLAVEYCKSLLKRDKSIRVMAVPRQGAAHGALSYGEGDLPSASSLRALLRTGAREQALRGMADAMRDRYLAEEAAGRAPVFYETVERAILAKLRSMTEEEFAALDEGREGLYHRLYRSVHGAASVAQVLERAKTKRYPLARLRRMVLWACLGIQGRPSAPLYLRPLAMNDTGRRLLAQMRTTLPVLSRAGHARTLAPEALGLLRLEERAAELYALAYPALAAADGGALWKEGCAFFGKERI